MSCPYRFGLGLVASGKGQHASRQGRRMREPRHIKNLLFVEGLAREQGFGKQIKLLAMRTEKPPSLVVALANDLEHLSVDDLSRLLAERPRISVPV